MIVKAVVFEAVVFETPVSETTLSGLPRQARNAAMVAGSELRSFRTGMITEIFILAKFSFWQSFHFGEVFILAKFSFWRSFHFGEVFILA